MYGYIMVIRLGNECEFQRPESHEELQDKLADEEDGDLLFDDLIDQVMKDNDIPSGWDVQKVEIICDETQRHKYVASRNCT